MKWADLKFWNSGEWQVIEERLDDLDRQGVHYNPTRDRLFASMELCPFETVRVCILGQDPYPNPKDACGLAFSSPSKDFPATLQEIFKEYQSDLGLQPPKSGRLDKWAKQGVLLWNVIPTCLAWKSLSHENWTEWSFLTQEVLETLSKETNCVFVPLGRFAKTYTDKFVKDENSHVLYYSHPSPRASRMSAVPFVGSRVFSTINVMLVKSGQRPIEWRL